MTRLTIPFRTPSLPTESSYRHCMTETVITCSSSISKTCFCSLTRNKTSSRVAFSSALLEDLSPIAMIDFTLSEDTCISPE